MRDGWRSGLLTAVKVLLHVGVAAAVDLARAAETYFRFLVRATWVLMPLAVGAVAFLLLAPRLPGALQQTWLYSLAVVIAIGSAGALFLLAIPLLQAGQAVASLLPSSETYLRRLSLLVQGGAVLGISLWLAPVSQAPRLVPLFLLLATLVVSLGYRGTIERFARYFLLKGVLLAGLITLGVVFPATTEAARLGLLELDGRLARAVRGLSDPRALDISVNAAPEEALRLEGRAYPFFQAGRYQVYYAETETGFALYDRGGISGDGRALYLADTREEIDAIVRYVTEVQSARAGSNSGEGRSTAASTLRVNGSETEDPPQSPAAQARRAPPEAVTGRTAPRPVEEDPQVLETSRRRSARDRAERALDSLLEQQVIGASRSDADLYTLLSGRAIDVEYTPSTVALAADAVGTLRTLGASVGTRVLDDENGPGGAAVFYSFENLGAAQAIQAALVDVLRIDLEPTGRDRSLRLVIR